METSPKPPGRRRFRLARHAGGIASLALAPLLLLQLGVFWFLHTGGEIDVPDFARDRLRDRLAQSGIACDWSSARVSLSGRIALTDARLGAPGDAEPVFEAGRLVAVLDIFDLVSAGRVTPRRLWLDRGRLVCPGVLSPSGKSEVALDNIRAALRMEGDRLIVETLQARCAGIPLVAHGRLLPPGMTTGAGGSPVSNHPLRAPGLAAARLVALRPWLEHLDDASLQLTGVDARDGVRLTLDGLASAVRLPGVEVGNIRLHFGAIWDRNGPHPEGRATFVVNGFHVDRAAEGALPALAGHAGRVSLGTSFGHDWELPTSAHLVADTIEAAGYPLDRLDLRLDWSALPALRFDAGALWRRENLAATGSFNSDTGEALVNYAARVRPDEIAEYPAYPKDLPPEVTMLKITGSADLTGTVTLGKESVFEKASVRLEAGQTRYGKIDVLSFRGAAEITPDKITANDLDAQSPEQRVQGFFESGYKADSRFRLILRGSAYPEQIEPFVGPWWHRIWKDLAAAPGHPVHADIDVDGHWEGTPYEFIFGSAFADRLSYRKQVFDHASLRITEEPARLSIYDMVVTNDDGTGAKGRMEWSDKMPEHLLDSVRLRFQGKLPLGMAAELGGDDVVAALADIRLDKPADATVLVRYHGPASPTPDREQLEVGVVSEGAFEAWKIPGEDFSGTVLIDGPRIQIKDAKLRYAGGDARADAWVHRLPEAYRLTFDAAFDKCDRTAFFAGLAKLKTETKPKPPAKPEPVKPVSRAELSGDIRARIILPDIATLDGQGHFITTDPDLLKLPLLGAVSRGLEKMGIDAGTYAFRSADSEFFIRDGFVYFPELTVRGPDAVVDVKGRYALASDALLFRAVLNPKSQERIPLLDWARAALNRTTKLFPVDIRGTLDKPEWAVDPTPSAIFSEKRDDSLGLPPPAPPDDGKW